MFRLIQLVEGEFVTSEFTAANLIPAMSARGFELAGVNSNPRQRAELQGQPKFTGLCGPTWDGGPIRYETPEAYARLSA